MFHLQTVCWWNTTEYPFKWKLQRSTSVFWKLAKSVHTGYMLQGQYASWCTRDRLSHINVWQLGPPGRTMNTMDIENCPHYVPASQITNSKQLNFMHNIARAKVGSHNRRFSVNMRHKNCTRHMSISVRVATHKYNFRHTTLRHNSFWDFRAFHQWNHV